MDTHKKEKFRQRSHASTFAQKKAGKAGGTMQAARDGGKAKGEGGCDTTAKKKSSTHHQRGEIRSRKAKRR